MQQSTTTSILSFLCVPLAAHAATISDGHVDIIGIGYEAGELKPHSHVEFGTVDGSAVGEGEYDPGELTFLVPASSQSSRPAGSQWDPIGVASGGTIFFLPELSTQADSLGSIFAGIGSEELTPTDWLTDIEISLTGASGPGEFSLAQVSGLGTPTFFMSTSDPGSDSYAISANDHQHFNWYFTEPGTYQMTFGFEGTHATDGVKQASATYNFNVVPEPSVLVLGALGVLGFLRRQR